MGEINEFIERGEAGPGFGVIGEYKLPVWHEKDATLGRAITQFEVARYELGRILEILTQEIEASEAEPTRNMQEAQSILESFRQDQIN